MSINFAKRKHMRIESESTATIYTFGANDLRSVNTGKDLEVMT